MASDKDPDDIESLLPAARAGDRRALGLLLRRLLPWIRKKARHYVGHASVPIGITSLTQEAALRLSRSIRGVRAANSPAVKALIARIVKNTSASAHRSAARIKRDPEGLLPEALMPEPAEQPDQRIERTEREERLQAAIARLPARQREAVSLLRQGASYQEIAQRLGCSMTATQMLLHRAKEELIQALRDPDPF